MVGFGSSLRDHSVLGLNFPMKKKLLTAILIFLILVSGYIYIVFQRVGDTQYDEVPQNKEAENKEASISIFKDKLEPIYGNPTRLYVPEFNIDSQIIEVGIDEKGMLEAPTSWYQLGWYDKSARTGQNGNTVIYGHYDDNHGRPASFWNLKNLKSGDKVYLVDSYSRVYTYEVTEVFFLDITDPSRLEVLESEEGKASLTLITCGGVWVSNRSTYDKRLVVKAERV